MQPPQSAANRPGVVILDEDVGDPLGSIPTVTVTLKEKASPILKDIGLNDEHTGQLGLNDAHHSLHAKSAFQEHPEM